VRRVCLIPMKPLALAKARLAPALAATERRRLAVAMLADAAAAAAATFEHVWVLCSDGEAAAAARAAGAEARPDPTPGAGLNASLAAATRDAVRAGAGGVLVLAADLPAATADDLERVATVEGVALAPDATGTGTNALWRQPPDAIPPAFGPGSRRRHEEAARAAGLALAVVEAPRLAADVDTLAGLAASWRLGVGPATRRAVAAMGLEARLRLAG
jgi:2-phospho-L-lactate guanylyltransferase